MNQLNMKYYKLKHHDTTTLKESLKYLSTRSAEKIYLQSYLLITEWDSNSNKNVNILDDIFSQFGEKKIAKLKESADEYNNGESTLDKFFDQEYPQRFAKKIKTASIKLFEKYKDLDSSKIDELELNKLKKGVLKNIWKKVIKLVNIINDPDTPKYIKTIAIGAIIYVLVPIDAVPDFIPVGGLVDDAAIILLALDQIKNFLQKK